MTSTFLIGGGWHVETFGQTYGRFLRSATQNGNRKIAIVVAEEPDGDSHAQFLRFLKAFEAAGLAPDEAVPMIVSAENPLTPEKLAATAATGIFVCGGLTPAYWDALCRNRRWLAFLNENRIPYCGFSAGAAIASQNAIIGGWRRKIDGQIVEIADENAGEDLDFLEIRQGLNLVPISIDVHATQWGTLSRLIHTVDAGSSDEGYAIDENTMLETDGKNFGVYGAGNVYRAFRQDGKITVEVLRSSSAGAKHL